MYVKVFAILKEYYQELFELKGITTVAQLKDHLLYKNPGAENIIKTSRYARNDHFIDLNTIVEEHETIYVLPPSSGG
jgi:molybdopterin converting factor small subunit